MKSGYRKIVAVFLGVVILISSNGIVLASHVCFSKCGKEVSLFVRKGCCSKKQSDCHRNPAAENTFKKKCCELKISFHRVDVSSQLIHGNHFTADYELLNYRIPEFLSSQNHPETFSINKAPPEPAGRTLLTNISLLLI